MFEVSLVSVIVPIYNSEKYLKDCIVSLVGQTYKNIEIILINDGSTDNSLRVCEYFQEYDNRIIIKSKRNEGQGVARNFGTKIAKGDFIVYVDSDDIIELDMIEKMMQIENKTNADIVGIELDEFDFIPQSREKDSFLITTFNKFQIMKKMIIETGYFYHVVVGKLIKKELLNQIIFPSIRAIEDEFFLTDLFLSIDSFSVANVSLYHYRRTPLSTMRRGYNMNRSNIVYALEDRKNKYKLFLPKKYIFIIQGEILLESAFWYSEIQRNSESKIWNIRKIFIKNFCGGFLSSKITIKMRVLLIINLFFPRLYEIVLKGKERNYDS